MEMSMLKFKSLEKFTAIAFAFVFMLMFQLSSSAQSMSDDTVIVPLLVIDEDPGLTMPGRFRTTKDEFTSSEKSPSKAGLDRLQAAASAQFSKTTLENALKKIDGPVWIVDLRQESHGFVDGMPISWYSKGNQSNAGESDDNLVRQEQMLINDVRRQGSILVSQILKKKEGVITKSRPIDIKVKNAQIEASLVTNLNLGYIRLGVLDHNRPSDATVDHFLEFTKTLPEEAWLYFHCRGGRGRSTTFMVMYDMIKNAKKVSLEDIVKRHALLGGSDLFNLKTDDDEVWKQPFIDERKAFITKFYNYAKDSRGYGKKTWTEWSNKH